MSKTSVSVIIPVHRDTKALRTTLENLSAHRPSWPVIVVDSDYKITHEEIAAICDHYGAALIYSPVAQRAHQMNLGARHAETEWLWFLHADTIPACAETLDAFERIIDSDTNIAGGGFERRFNPMGWFLKITTRWADWRGKAHGLYLGDQAMFIRRDVFTELGGFPPFEKFEDLSLSRALTLHAEKRNQKIAHVSPGVITSARRFEALGEVRTTLRDLWWTANHLIRGEQRTWHPKIPHAPIPTVILMLKAPHPGTVKTRLAESIGDQEACAAYRRMVEHQLHQIPKTWKVHVFYSPDDAKNEMKDWLAAHKVDRFTPQCGGDLGDRLTAAGKTVKGPVIFLGGDSPWMTHERLRFTHELLSYHQAVINPAFDGGYTMLALLSFDTHVFDAINWSTDEVFQSTTDRLKSLGWKSARLSPVSDVDTINDWESARELLHKHTESDA